MLSACMHEERATARTPGKSVWWQVLVCWGPREQPLRWAHLGPLCANWALWTQRIAGLLPGLYSSAIRNDSRACRKGRAVHSVPAMHPDRCARQWTVSSLHPHQQPARAHVPVPTFQVTAQKLAEGTCLGGGHGCEWLRVNVHFICCCDTVFLPRPLVFPRASREACELRHLKPTCLYFNTFSSPLYPQFLLLSSWLFLGK